MRKQLKNTLLVSILVCLAFSGCQSRVKTHPVDFVERNTALAVDRSRKPFLLVVEIDENGKLRLNRIETGTIADISLLSEKLEAIFEDRERNSNNEKAVVIDPRGEVKKEDVERLIESLEGVKASPIRVVKNDL